MGKKKLVSKRKTPDGKTLTRSDSRLCEDTTYFTMRGDSETSVGDGTIMTWDFTNNTDEVTDSITTAVPDGFKRKRIKLSFADNIYIKEGTIYWKDAVYGTYIDFWIVCPDGQYYLERSGTPAQASGDTPLVHYVNYHMIMGDCFMGDELNTESANEDPIPPNYELWIEVTTPTSDSSSCGSSELELYRIRTHLLPGENI